MTEEVAVGIISSGASSLMSSDWPVVIILVMLVAILSFVCWQLWKGERNAQGDRMDHMKAAIEGLKGELGECRESHRMCDIRNRKVAQAVIDAMSGRTQEALIRAQDVLSGSDGELT